MRRTVKRKTKKKKMKMMMMMMMMSSCRQITQGSASVASARR